MSVASTCKTRKFIGSTLGFLFQLMFLHSIKFSSWYISIMNVTERHLYENYKIESVCNIINVPSTNSFTLRERAISTKFEGAYLECSIPCHVK